VRDLDPPSEHVRRAESGGGTDIAGVLLGQIAVAARGYADGEANCAGSYVPGVVGRGCGEAVDAECEACSWAGAVLAGRRGDAGECVGQRSGDVDRLINGVRALVAAAVEDGDLPVDAVESRVFQITIRGVVVADVRVVAAIERQHQAGDQ
jgi:hypothetical protein